MRASMFVLDQTVRYVAIIKRYKDGRNYYVVPGGKVEAHENIQQAAIREIAEELGLAIEQSDIFDSIIFCKNQLLLSAIKDSGGRKRTQSSA